MKRLPLLVAGTLLVAALGAAGWWYQAGVRRDAVQSWLPPPPDLTDASPALLARIESAATAARGRTDPVAGLATLAGLYHINGYLETAMAAYEGLAALDPTEPRWPHLHATILAGYGQAEPALALWERVVALAPDYVPALLRVADLRLKGNERDAATAAYQAVLAVDRANPYATLGLARLDLEAERWNDARERLERVVGQTNYTLGYDLIVSLYERLGLTERAEAIRGTSKASGAFRDPPDPWLDALLVDCYDPFRLGLEAGTKARSGDPEGAIRLLEQAIAVAPQDLSSHFQLAGLLAERRLFPRALELYRRCTQLDPEFSDGWAQLSGLLERTGNQAEAARILDAGLAACPESPGLHLMKARALRAANQPGAAIAAYRTSIRLRPNEPDAYLELGMALIGLGRAPEGVRELRLALETDPANPTALGILAFHAIEAGNRADADAYLIRIDAQPRVERAQRDQLLTAYRTRFGTPWRRPS